MKKRRYFILPLISLLLALAACRSSKEMEEAALGETAEKATPVMTVVMIVTPEPPTPTSRPLWTATPTLEPVLPPEIVRSFDREQCPDYCWHDIMLGQSEAEVLAAIRNDPATDKVAELNSQLVPLPLVRIDSELEGLSNEHYTPFWFSIYLLTTSSVIQCRIQCLTC